MFTQFPNAPSLIPRSRATSTTSLPVSKNPLHGLSLETAS
jgi:hypothetical protein